MLARELEIEIKGGEERERKRLRYKNDSGKE